MERIGEPWIPGRPYRDRIGVYALVCAHSYAHARRGGRLLCVLQETPEKVELQLPGGGVDPREHPLGALHREVREETGWTIAPARRVAAFQSFTWAWGSGYWARKVHLVYLARAVGRRGPPTEPGHTPLWLTPAEAARRLDVPGDRAMVRRAIAAGLLPKC